MENSQFKDYYKILGLDISAPTEIIEQACLKLGEQLRKSSNGSDQYAPSRFADLEAAYDVLTNPVLREEYDRRYMDQTLRTAIDSSLVDTVAINKRDGLMMIVVGLASIPLWLILSDGYIPNIGILGSLLDHMQLYEAKWFCETKFVSGREYAVTSCWEIDIRTKYATLLSLVTMTYGILLYLQIAWNPVDHLRSRKTS